MGDEYATRSHLIAFLYELMRDHVSPEMVEDIVAQDEQHGGTGYSLSNRELAEKAEELATRLTR